MVAADVVRPMLISAFKNRQVGLPCSLHHNNTAVVWKFCSRRGFNDTLIYSDGEFIDEHLDDSRRNHIKLISEHVGQFDLFINKARIDDSGTYRCEDSNHGLREIYILEGE